MQYTGIFLNRFSEQRLKFVHVCGLLYTLNTVYFDRIEFTSIFLIRFSEQRLNFVYIYDPYVDLILNIV